MPNVAEQAMPRPVLMRRLYRKDCIEAAGGTWPTGWSYQSNWYDYDNVHTSPPGDGEISWYVRTTDQTKTVKL